MKSIVLTGSSFCVIIHYDYADFLSRHRGVLLTSGANCSTSHMPLPRAVTSLAGTVTITRKGVRYLFLSLRDKILEMISAVVCPLISDLFLSAP